MIDVPQLTSGLVRCEEAAWRDFHGGYFSRLKAQAMARGVAESDAAEVVQRVYLRILRHVKVFQADTDFDAWLSCLVRCESIDAGRRANRRTWMGERFQQWQELRRPGSVAEGLDLESAMNQLEQCERELLVRHYVEGWSQEELAREQATTPKAVESKLARLRRRLRVLLENPDVC
ncbi:sigma-70 family RNA polymerase sigma factor [Luteolibacter arcticus]|uniref:Sigma-70 family RNA polymerase sigma factor n=1 Tax=Luteolibacter arcticus TaxID=1581411 RepID=A0ABT3GCV9_9BACT|nr:sigma-70 family RNA polymerase sigma factor [Luteolibacter arcticus]MCW1921449.1 sigma-70 family RNA polymerase sigma factor [Luteolibacter arcticus]